MGMMYGAGSVPRTQPAGAASGDSFSIVLSGFGMVLLNNTRGMTKVGCGDAANGWIEHALIGHNYVFVGHTKA